ncbi:unnamed protein product, partial [Urochloa humidicola]
SRPFSPQIHSHLLSPDPFPHPVLTLCGGARRLRRQSRGRGRGPLLEHGARGDAPPATGLRIAPSASSRRRPVGRRHGGTGAWSLRASSVDRCSHPTAFLHMSRSSSMSQAEAEELVAVGAAGSPGSSQSCRSSWSRNSCNPSRLFLSSKGCLTWYSLEQQQACPLSSSNKLVLSRAAKTASFPVHQQQEAASRRRQRGRRVRGHIILNIISRKNNKPKRV